MRPATLELSLRPCYSSLDMTLAWRRAAMSGLLLSVAIVNVSETAAWQSLVSAAHQATGNPSVHFFAEAPPGRQIQTEKIAMLP